MNKPEKYWMDDVGKTMMLHNLWWGFFFEEFRIFREEWRWLHNGCYPKWQELKKK